MICPWPVEAGQAGELSPAETEQLRALGYVGDAEDSVLETRSIDFAPHSALTQTPVPFSLESRPVTDLLASFKDKKSIEIAGRNREAVMVKAGQALSWEGAIPAGASLSLGVGQAYAQIRPGALVVQLDILDAALIPVQQEILSPIAGLWVDRVIDLASHAGQEIRLVLTFYSLDPSLDEIPLYLAPLLVARPPDGKKPPHVFFILVDTLRADALGCYGQKSGVTPHLDRLAREGVLFENMIAQSPHTETSVPSILQGVYPHEHGRMYLRSRHNAANPEYVGSRSLKSEYPTLAERFQQAGYLTYGFYNNILLAPRDGFHRGFYEYMDYAVGVGLSDPWGRIALPTAQTGVQETIAFLERVPKQAPLFVFLHILDPHNPYTPPGEFNLRIKPPGLPLDEAAYLSETAYVDEQIGRLVDALQRLGLYQDSLLLVTSDHGEEFINPYGRPLGHGRTLFHTTLHVPFLCVGPSRIPAGKRAPNRTESVDIAPSLLELAGLPLDQKLSGKSFVSLFASSGAPYDKTEAIAEGIRRGEERKCLYQDPYKLVFFRDSGRVMLYDLRNDPGELKDIAPENPDVVNRLQKRLLERFGLTESGILPLQVTELGQDGHDFIHTFHRDTSFWQPGIADVHLQVNPVPEKIARVAIWADDHLHGARNHSQGWNWPPEGEQPVAVEPEDGALQLYFEMTENLTGSTIFVRIEDQNQQAYLGSFAGRNVSLEPRPAQTRDTRLEQWDFENPDALKPWTMGKTGTLSLFKRDEKATDTLLRFDTAAASGMFRVFHPVANLPAGRRVLFMFDLGIASGGVKIDLIHPKTARVIGSHAFALEGSGQAVTVLPKNRITACGLTGITLDETDLLFLVSNYSPGGGPTQAWFDNLAVSLYPAEWENAGEAGASEPEM
ncbi:MAG: sulfatase [bacterium]